LDNKTIIMKGINKLSIVCIIIFSSVFQMINAQEISHSLKLNVLPVLAESSDYLSYASFRTQFSVIYEQHFSKLHPFVKISYVGPIQYYQYFTYENESSDKYYNISGFGIGVGNRFYQDDYKGIYIAPEFEYYKTKKFKASSEGLLTFTSEYSISAKLGKQWIKDSGFTLDIYTGIGFILRNYKEIIEETEIQTAQYSGAGFRPYLGFCFGYSF